MEVGWQKGSGNKPEGSYFTRSWTIRERELICNRLDCDVPDGGDFPGEHVVVREPGLVGRKRSADMDDVPPGSTRTYTPFFLRL